MGGIPMPISMALTFPEGVDPKDPKNIKQLFIADGSYLRRDGKPIIHALSLFFTAIDFDGDNWIVRFEGQPVIKVLLAADKNPPSVTFNGRKQKATYHSETKIIELKVHL